MKSLKAFAILKNAALSSRSAHNGMGGFKLPHSPLKITFPDKGVVIENVKKRVYDYMDVYEDFIGIKQVKEAHLRVIRAENDFVMAQELRRTVHKQLNEVQNLLRDNRYDLERTSRGEDRYLELIKQEIALVRQERSFREKFEENENNERDNFNTLSNALRLSHEKERAQNEKTKYWSLIGSVVGATIGIIGATINSRLKIRQMKQVMIESSRDSDLLIQAQLTEVVSVLKSLPAGTDPNTKPHFELIQNLNKSTEKLADATNEFTATSTELVATLDTLKARLDTLGKPSKRSVYLIDSQPKDEQTKITVLSSFVVLGFMYLLWGRPTL